MPPEIPLDALDLRAFIRPGDAIVIGQGCAEPLSLTEALVRERAALGRVRVFLGPNFSGTLRPEHGDYLAFLAYAASGHNQRLARAGLLDIVPAHYSELPRYLADGTIPCDVLLLQMAPAAAGGGFALGMANDYQLEAGRRARVVLAEVNEQVPWVAGTELPADLRIDAVVRSDRAPAMLAPTPLGEVEARIAARVADLVPEGATIELGIGALPDAILAALRHHRDLGIHSGMLGDGVADLVAAGAITNARKPLDRGITIGGLLFGTRRLFDFAHRNPALKLMPPSYTHGAHVLRQLPRFVALNSAIEVDLTGQANGEMAGGVYLGAVGGQADFMRGAAASEGGRSILALPATAKGGTVSRIVPRLGDGVVTSLRGDMDVVVTEWGVAELRGRSLAERARRLIAIAAPPFRDELARAAHSLIRAGV